MKYLKPINEFWGDVLKRDLLGETRKEDNIRSIEELRDYIISEIDRQGKNVVIKNLDISSIEDVCWLFSGRHDLESIDLSGWKTSNVTDMNNMFFDCRKIKSINLSGWDTSNVKNMGALFWNCRHLESLDLSGWDTSNVNTIREIFYNCEKLESLDLSGWDTSNVTDMRYAFSNCPAPYEVINNKIVKI